MMSSSRVCVTVGSACPSPGGGGGFHRPDTKDPGASGSTRYMTRGSGASHWLEMLAYQVDSRRYIVRTELKEQHAFGQAPAPSNTTKAFPPAQAGRRVIESPAMDPNCIPHEQLSTHQNGKFAIPCTLILPKLL